MIATEQLTWRLHRRRHSRLIKMLMRQLTSNDCHGVISCWIFANKPSSFRLLQHLCNGVFVLKSDKNWLQTKPAKTTKSLSFDFERSHLKGFKKKKRKKERKKKETFVMPRVKCLLSWDENLHHRLWFWSTVAVEQSSTNPQPALHVPPPHPPPPPHKGTTLPYLWVFWWNLLGVDFRVSGEQSTPPLHFIYLKTNAERRGEEKERGRERERERESKEQVLRLAMPANWHREHIHLTPTIYRLGQWNWTCDVTDQTSLIQFA